jgi:SEC-C motif
MSRAPSTVTPKILELARLATGQDVDPVYVASRPEPGADTLDSFAIVDGVVAERGGSRVTGWGLLEQDWFLEAELRYVWRSPSGELIDVTPPPFPMSGSLFVEDAGRDDDGRQVDSVRMATTDHPAVSELLAAYAAQFELYNRGDRADEHGEIHLSDAENIEHQEILARGNRALRDLARATPPPPGRNDPCSCGSGLKYKKCHGA